MELFVYNNSNNSDIISDKEKSTNESINTLDATHSDGNWYLTIENLWNNITEKHLLIIIIIILLYKS